MTGSALIADMTNPWRSALTYDGRHPVTARVSAPRGLRVRGAVWQSARSQCALSDHGSGLTSHPPIAQRPPRHPWSDARRRSRLYVDDLAALVPWTAEAIRTKVRRGELQRGVHYFQEGPRARLIFKWDAIVAFIERMPTSADIAAANGNRRAVLDVEQATAALHRLLQEPSA